MNCDCSRENFDKECMFDHDFDCENCCGLGNELVESACGCCCHSVECSVCGGSGLKPE